MRQHAMQAEHHRDQIDRHQRQYGGRPAPIEIGIASDDFVEPDPPGDRKNRQHRAEERQKPFHRARSTAKTTNKWAAVSFAAWGAIDCIRRPPSHPSAILTVKSCVRVNFAEMSLKTRSAS
jgi:hypothetical protein